MISPKAKKNNIFLMNSILIGIVIMTCIYIIGGTADLKNVNKSFLNTVDHLKQQCISFDEILESDKVKSLIRLTEQAREVSFDICMSTDFLNEKNMLEYADEQRLSGIMVLDENYDVVSQCGTDGLSYNDWSEYLNKTAVRDVIYYNKKIYSERVDLNNVIYDVAFVSRLDSPGIIFCYKHQATEITLINQSSIENLLSGYEMEMGGIVYITEGDTVRGTNDKQIRGRKRLNYDIITKSKNIKPGKFGKLKTDTQTYYGGVVKYRKYDLYVFYPSREIFEIRRWLCFLALFIHILLCLLWYILKNITEKKHIMELNYQTDTIKAISEIYTITLLFDLKNNKVSVIQAPKGLSDKIVKLNGIQELSDMISNTYIADEFKNNYKNFFDLNTLNQRLKNKKYIEHISRDIYNIWYRTIIIPKERDSHGNVVSVVMVTRNIDEQKKRELNYREKLKKTTLEAVRANNAKTDFLRRMSHDVRTPINVIKGMNELALKFPDDIKKQQYCREKINQSTILLLDLVNDVLAVNMLDSDRFYLDEKAFDLSDLIKDACSITEIQAREKNIEWEVKDTVTEHTELIGSPIHFKQIIMNIMSNAVKYTNDGGKITVECVEINYDDEKSTVRFVCSDTGIGMSKNFQMHMFDAFAREQQEIKTEYQGIGLGLAIVKKLTNKMNGKIYVESKKNVGSKFTIDIPFKINNENSFNDARIEKDDFSISGKNILLVEDNELNMEIAEYMLEEQNANVVKAVNGKQAVEIWNKSETGYFDVILMDIMMPEMDGIEATKAIRSESRSDAKKVPIIAMSANVFDDDTKRCVDAGMNDHISKPFEAEKMLYIIYKNCGNNKH